jgi:hypothetical protein
MKDWKSLGSAGFGEAWDSEAVSTEEARASGCEYSIEDPLMGLVPEKFGMLSYLGIAWLWKVEWGWISCITSFWEGENGAEPEPWREGVEV